MSRKKRQNLHVHPTVLNSVGLLGIYFIPWYVVAAAQCVLRVAEIGTLLTPPSPLFVRLHGIQMNHPIRIDNS